MSSGDIIAASAIVTALIGGGVGPFIRGLIKNARARGAWESNVNRAVDEVLGTDEEPGLAEKVPSLEARVAELEREARRED